MRPDIRTLQFSVLLSIIVALAAAFVVRPAAAHHGWGGYDSAQLLDLTGTIQEVTFENPHGTLRLETPEKTWLIILSPPRRMINRGLEAEMLEVGDTVSVQGYPHKTDPAEMRAERIVVNGTSVELR